MHHILQPTAVNGRASSREVKSTMHDIRWAAFFAEQQLRHGHDKRSSADHQQPSLLLRDVYAQLILLHAARLAQNNGLDVRVERSALAYDPRHRARLAQSAKDDNEVLDAVPMSSKNDRIPKLPDDYFLQHSAQQYLDACTAVPDLYAGLAGNLLSRDFNVSSDMDFEEPDLSSEASVLYAVLRLRNVTEKPRSFVLSQDRQSTSSHQH
ncbi:hypothetical protein EV715DRAFT_296142 [Schizophyllum commune]